MVTALRDGFLARISPHITRTYAIVFQAANKYAPNPNVAGSSGLQVTGDVLTVTIQKTHVCVPCSVDLPSYVAGSWLGMLPGTIAYVYAGNYGRALIDGDGDVGGVKGWQVALGLGITVLAVGYIGKLAKKALDDVEKDEGTTSTRS